MRSPEGRLNWIRCEETARATSRRWWYEWKQPSAGVQLVGYTACAAGTLAILVIEFGPVLWATLPVVAAITWARVGLRDHIPSQVIARAFVGYVVATSVMVALH